MTRPDTSANIMAGIPNFNSESTAMGRIIENEINSFTQRLRQQADKKT